MVVTDSSNAITIFRQCRLTIRDKKNVLPSTDVFVETHSNDMHCTHNQTQTDAKGVKTAAAAAAVQ